MKEAYLWSVQDNKINQRNSMGKVTTKQNQLILCNIINIILCMNSNISPVKLQREALKQIKIYIWVSLDCYIY